MIISFKEYFPWAGADGLPERTGFREKILACVLDGRDGRDAGSEGCSIERAVPKLHTIRRVPANGRPRYREGMRLQFATGPRFKKVVFAEAVCTGVQLIKMVLYPTPFLNQMELCCYHGEKLDALLTGKAQRALHANDGLSDLNFTKWFLLDLITNGPGVYQLVHWTDARY